MMRTNFENIEIITNQLIIIVSWVVILFFILGLIWLYEEVLNDKNDKNYQPYKKNYQPYKGLKKKDTTKKDTKEDIFRNILHIVFLFLPLIFVGIGIIREVGWLIIYLYHFIY